MPLSTIKEKIATGVVGSVLISGITVVANNTIMNYVQNEQLKTIEKMDDKLDQVVEDSAYLRGLYDGKDESD